LIQLTKTQWDALFRDVLLAARKMTYTKVEKRKPTQRDRAMEAVQRAFDRFFRVDPPGLDATDALRRYLVWAVRSELSNVHEQQETRAAQEAAAAVEQETVAPSIVASPDQMSVEDAEAERGWARDARRLAALKQRLTGDRIALATLDCAARGEDEPAKQAATLGCPIEEIYNARRRRKRAIDDVLAAERDEDDEENE
jgi:hypothetical protein